MRIQLAFATTSALALALSACGGEPETEGADAVEAPEEAVADEAVAGVEEGEAVEETGTTETEDTAEAGEEAAEPEPVASATPAPTATPAQAAAATPPQAFSTCGVCHSTEPGVNMIGPSLAGVVGRQAGSVSGFSYSPAMHDAGVTWTEANLRSYIANPAAVVPGGTMPNPGVSAADAEAIVNYLKTL